MRTAQKANYPPYDVPINVIFIGTLALSAWSNAGVNLGIIMGTEFTELTENIAFSVR